MAKKQTDKKKINIKLLSGQTYLVLTTDQMFQVSSSLLHYASLIKDDKEKAELLSIIEEVSKCISENSYLGDGNNEEEW